MGRFHPVLHSDQPRCFHDLPDFHSSVWIKNALEAQDALRYRYPTLVPFTELYTPPLRENCQRRVRQIWTYASGTLPPASTIEALWRFAQKARRSPKIIEKTAPLSRPSPQAVKRSCAAAA